MHSMFMKPCCCNGFGGPKTFSRCHSPVVRMRRPFFGPGTVSYQMARFPVSCRGFVDDDAASEGIDENIVRTDILRRELLFVGAASSSLLSSGLAYGDVIEGKATSVYDITATMYGEPYPLSQHEGKVMCIVNVASM